MNLADILSSDEEAPSWAGPIRSLVNYISKQAGGSPFFPSTTKSIASSLSARDPRMTQQADPRLYQPQVESVMNPQPDQMDRIATLLAPLPGVGDVAGAAADVRRYATDPESRTPGNFALSAAGLLPFIPNMTVWHGSPHLFDKFDIGKIGTGEGAQKYGHGLYVAEAPGVAGEYRKTLTGDGFRIADGEVFNPSTLQHLNVRTRAYRGDLDGAIETAKTIAASDSPVASKAASDFAVLSSIKDRGGMTKNQGALYKVDLPDEHIARMLDWDKPLSAQHDDVQRKLIDIANSMDEGSGFVRAAQKGASGKELYEQLGKQLGSQEAATKLLRSYDLPGIKYLDAGSRINGDAAAIIANYGTREKALEVAQQRLKNASVVDRKYWDKIVNDLNTSESRNFVVFDDKLLKILGRE